MKLPVIDVLEVAKDGSRVELRYGNVTFVFHRGSNGQVVKSATRNESRIFDPAANSLPSGVNQRAYALADQIMEDYARRHAAKALQTELSIH